MAVQDYYFALQNLSNSDKIFGYYSGSAAFNYAFDHLTQSAQPGNGDVRLNSGSLLPGSTTNEISSTQIYIDDRDEESSESIINYLTRLDDLNDKGQVKIEVSGSASYNLTFDVGVIETGSANLDYMIVNVTNGSGNTPSGADNNPISQSYVASTSSYTIKKPIIVTFTGSELKGYHEIDVTGSSTKYIVASSGSFTTSSGQPSTGSLPAPFSIDWGVPESTFEGANYFPSSRGYAWLWNDGYKVKHIKLNNISSTGDTLTNFIKGSEWVRFVMYNPIDATGSLLHPGDGSYAEDYQLHNVTQYLSQGYSHLFVDQESEDTTFATDVSEESNIEDTFLATGDYIVYASSSGTVVEPTRSIGVDRSLPQGYFPSSSADYPTEQFFRGWAGANYYVNGNLVTINGTLDDPLQSFNSGSTERDKDGESVYVPSSLPFFIDATGSYIQFLTASFVEWANQTNLTKIGPGFETINGDELVYYYKEDTNQIVIKGSEYLDIRKKDDLDFDPLYDVELVGPNHNNNITYTTPEGFDILVQPSQSLWLSRGLANIGTQNGNLWKYNRHLHRPFKAYALTSTGSITIGYGDQDPDAIYGTGSFGPVIRPVGPPPNEFESVYISYSSSIASERPNDGLYTFDNPLLEPLHITASVDLGYTSIDVIRSSSYGTGSYGDDEFEYGGTGSGDEVFTWQTASLKLYQNSNVIATKETYIDSSNILYDLTSSLKTTLQPYQVALGDTLKLSLEVENEANGFNSSLVVNSYTMSFDNLVYPSDGLAPVTFNNYLELNDDCNPLINNIAADRPNQRLQDVDYSVNILDPINFNQIINDEAVRATVPESNYTQLGFTNQRYFGSSTTREQINEYNKDSSIDTLNNFIYTNLEVSNKGKGPKLGKVPNVELKNSYIAYFNKIVDPYPNLNNKTAYYVKYLIDETGTIFDPTLSDINFSIFEKTFQLYDYDLKPTRVKASLQNIEEAKELSQLNEGLANTFKIGQYPVPILYSQNSSTSHVTTIPLSGSKFYTDLGIGTTFSDFSFNADATSSAAFASNNDSSVDFSNTVLEFEGIGSDIIINPDGTGSYDGSGRFVFPNDANAESPNTTGENLSDNYSLNGKFKFYTTSIPPAYEFSTYARDDHKCCKAEFMDFTFNVHQKYPSSSTYVKSIYGFKFNSLTLKILTNADTSSPTIYSIPIPLGRQTSKRGTTEGLRVTTEGVKLNLNSQWLWEQITIALDKSWNNSGRLDTLLQIGGGWDGDGYQGDTVQWEWELDFTLASTPNYFKQGSGYFFSAEGNILPNQECRRNNRDYFTNFNGTSYDKNNGFKWKRSFFPQVYGTERYQPELELSLISPFSSNANNQNGAVAPYWRRVPNTNNQLYMSSSALNQSYALLDENGNPDKYYVQAKIEYIGSTNPDFPGTQEPDFIEMDPVTDVWSLKVGDEIRFENSEELVYTITSIDGQEPIIPPIFPNENEDINKKLKITVSPSFENSEPSNFDFFVVRRYKENKNFIILDQQKPYGFPVSASSSPGILLPEHRIETYDRNPDEVLKDLIEKRII